MAEHSKAHANKENGHTLYLSKTICEEFISLIGSSVHDSIICELKNSKYYTISLDSTPDISNIDQLTLIVRYVLPTGPVERFIKFFDMDSHNAEYLLDKLLTFLNENGLDIGNCRGQSYDNAGNMSGRYNDLQAQIKQSRVCGIRSLFCSFIIFGWKMCCWMLWRSKHFLCCCRKYLHFFLHTPIAGICLRLPYLMATKPSQQNICRIPGGRLAQIPLKHFFRLFYNASPKWHYPRQPTKGGVPSTNSWITFINEVRNWKYDYFLESNIAAFSTDQCFPAIFWARPELCLCTLRINLWLCSFSSFHLLRYLKKAIDLTETEEYEQQRRRKRKRNRIYDNECGISSGADPSAPIQTPSQRFKRTGLFVIIDNLLFASSKRQTAYEKLNSVWGFYVGCNYPPLMKL